MKLLHALTYETTLFDELQKKYPDSQFIRATTPEDFERECSDCDAIIIAGSFYNQAVADILRKSAKKLRWIQAGSDGLDKFVKPGAPDGVTITNTSGTKGGTIAEHAMGMLIALYQKIHLFERLRAGKDWLQNRSDLRPQIGSIEGHTLVLAGYGHIGKEIARKAKAFNATVIAINRSGKGDGSADEIVTFDQLHDVLPKADALMLCMPFTKETRGLFGKKEIEMLKPGAMIVNVARGELIDTDAMVQALKDGKLGGAGLDVIEPEPLPADHPLWDIDNVIISPHVAAHGGPLYQRLAELYADNVDRFIKGEPLHNVVNLEDHAV
jgi:D-2-hydroxyacid dehydrogenase (NADP+)